ncbi:hypothetical protein FKM82_029267 [Ascaphus truei]
MTYDIHAQKRTRQGHVSHEPTISMTNGDSDTDLPPAQKRGPSPCSWDVFLPSWVIIIRVGHGSEGVKGSVRSLCIHVHLYG